MCRCTRSFGHTSVSAGIVKFSTTVEIKVQSGLAEAASCLSLPALWASPVSCTSQIRSVAEQETDALPSPNSFVVRGPHHQALCEGAGGSVEFFGHGSQAGLSIKCITEKVTGALFDKAADCISEKG